LHGRRPLLLGGRLSTRQGRPAGVVDHDVEASEPINGFCDEVTDGVVTVQVTRDDEHVATGRVADLLRCRLQIWLRPTAQGDLDALLREHFGTRPPQPLRCASDDRDLVFQLEVHGGVIEANARVVKSSGREGERMGRIRKC